MLKQFHQNIVQNRVSVLNVLMTKICYTMFNKQKVRFEDSHLIQTRGHARFARIPLVVCLGDSWIRRTQAQANLMRIFQGPQWPLKLIL